MYGRTVRNLPRADPTRKLPARPNPTGPAPETRSRTTTGAGAARPQSRLGPTLADPPRDVAMPRDGTEPRAARPGTAAPRSPGFRPASPRAALARCAAASLVACLLLACGGDTPSGTAGSEAGDTDAASADATADAVEEPSSDAARDPVADGGLDAGEDGGEDAGAASDVPDGPDAVSDVGSRDDADAGDAYVDADGGDADAGDAFADAGDLGTDASTDAGPVDATPDAAPPCDVLTRVYGPEPFPGSRWLASEAPRCARPANAMVVPSGARWELQVADLPTTARVYVYGPGFRAADAAGGVAAPDIARSDFAGDAGEVAVAFEAERSGEYVAVIERDDVRVDETYRVRVVCREGCDREATRYPVVLVHGYAGVDSYFGLLDYFYDVHDPLEGRGYDVFTPVTDPIATSERRAEQLAEQVDAILESTRAERINIIAHSQGGLDARVLVSGMGYDDRVASITTVATPHRGVPAVLWDFFSVQSFDPGEMEAFNARYTDHPAVRYWSWSARTCGALAFGCRSESDGESVDAFLLATYTLLRRFGDNDGIVTTESMVWGEHLGLLYADHFDEVGQIADRSSSSDPFDHRAFYLSEVRRLASAGL